MECLACRRTMPPVIREPNFCFGCGRPLRQYCPACGTTSRIRLPLYNGGAGARRPTSSCYSCNNLFKACSTCFRLHTLDAVRCLTSGCTGTLQEPIRPFPSPLGPLNGTRNVDWPGRFQLPRDENPRQIERIQLMAFRYGLLIAAGRTDIRTYEWSGTRWEQHSIQVYPGNRALTARGLIVQQGRIFLLAQEGTMVYSLAGNLLLAYEDSRVYLQQAVGPDWWARLDADGNITLQRGEAWEGEEVELPRLAGKPICMTTDATGSRVYVGTDAGQLLKIDPYSDQRPYQTQTIYDTQGAYRWNNLAVVNGFVALLGRATNNLYDPNRAQALQPALAIINTEGQMLQGPRDLPAGTLSDFAWAGNRLYIGREQEQDAARARGSFIDIYNTQTLTQNPETRTLDAATRTLAGIMAFTNQDGDIRLLLQRKGNPAQKYVMFDPNSGTRADISSPTDESQLACLADSRLVIARHRNMSTFLDTLPIVP